MYYRTKYQPLILSDIRQEGKSNPQVTTTDASQLQHHLEYRLTEAKWFNDASYTVVQANMSDARQN
jgi:hypothetical protein